ncbi:MarR family transcriptional regulator [Rhizobium leguminosarum bv. viciae]|uniref:MarR family winged helix-turn-helix transcriptional regulator n=1 Tax=Rhizobium leguminosarum TaxID=384 RepID=UPI0014425A1A|nr:MarR family winged helix-turn-helix transcriptional regulator [Rhizobium leguminosarum]NKK98460.1 MarR family transcriptional regulator [Rhizobium leguminosarum bv. viciae]
MDKLQRTPAGTALTDLILDLFRLNNRMINAGDKLVDGLGLTSARWQVLGTVVTAGRPQPVAWLARDMGANRQNVQRIVNDLEKEGLLTFQPNPHHRRAQLVVLTVKGEQAYETAMRLQAPWVDLLAEGFQVEDLKTTHTVMKVLRSKLEGHGDVEEQA